MHPDPLFTIKLFNQEFSANLYGVFIAIGILACFLVLTLYSKHAKMDGEVIYFTYFVALFAIGGGFLFAKIFQTFFEMIENGISFSDAWENSGITVMSGLIGGTAVFLVLWFAGGNLYFRGKKRGIHKYEIKKLYVIAPICVALAHAFGRLGCLMAGCCHGAEVGENAGGIFMYLRDKGYDGYAIPTQLYESLFLFALFGVLSFLFFKKINLTHVVYFIGYGIWRFIIEFFRDDDRGEIFKGVNITPSQVTSILFIVCGLIILGFIIAKKLPIKLEFSAYSKERIRDNNFKTA